MQKVVLSKFKIMELILAKNLYNPQKKNIENKEERCRKKDDK